MPVFLLPQFIADLQNHDNPHFAKRVLQKTLHQDGSFRPDRNDHQYHGIDDAWIRYVSRRQTAYRVIYLQRGDKIYLYRAGEHSVEDGLARPTAGAEREAVPVMDAGSAIAAALANGASKTDAPAREFLTHTRFRRNLPTPEINREIFSRRNLPHKDIWLVAPYIDAGLLAPTAPFGKLLFDQSEDGASVVIVTAPPADKEIGWMEMLAERNISIYVYPRLHTKLYCFMFDEDRRYDLGLQNGDRYSSLILVGSANLTSPGMDLGSGHCNEELCYSVPESENGFVETYMANLMMKGYDLPSVRKLLARGQWQNIGSNKW